MFFSKPDWACGGLFNWKPLSHSCCCVFIDLCKLLFSSLKTCPETDSTNELVLKTKLHVTHQFLENYMHLPFICGQLLCFSSSHSASSFSHALTIFPAPRRSDVKSIFLACPSSDRKTIMPFFQAERKPLPSLKQLERAPLSPEAGL